jgi:hypothetical protein
MFYPVFRHSHHSKYKLHPFPDLTPGGMFFILRTRLLLSVQEYSTFISQIGEDLRDAREKVLDLDAALDCFADCLLLFSA